MKTALTLLLIAIPIFASAQAPVEIERVEPHSHILCAMAAAMSGDGSHDPWGSCLRLTYKNADSRRIAGIRFAVNFVSAMKETDPSTYYIEDDRELKPGKSASNHWKDGLFWSQFGKDKMEAKVTVAKVMFADGTFWTSPIDISAARLQLQNEIDEKMQETGGTGYSQVTDNVLFIHSNRADETRFKATQSLVPRLKSLQIVKVVYTNDDDKVFTLEIPPS